MGISQSGSNTCFIRLINCLFEKVGTVICYAPWTFILLSTLFTIMFSLRIPFTPMVNNISDFTPYGARSRQELKIYQEFFSNRGEPKAIYAFITAKKGTNLLTLQHLNETIQVLDKISLDFYLPTSTGLKNFEQFCSGFCQLNDPVRHFYSGLLVNQQHSKQSNHLNLGYPVTSILGTKIFMDPNFFGVRIAVADRLGREKVVSVADSSALDEEAQLPNNIRELDLVVLQFRAEIGSDVSNVDLEKYERSIVEYFDKSFVSGYINVYVLTDSFITFEIVRAGLTLLPFLVIGFIIMAAFSAISFSISSLLLKQMNVYKIVLAIMACVTPFMACGVTLGGMFMAGFRFGSILCVTPFLVLAIGVDDAYLMVNSWQRITCQKRKLKVNDVDIEVRHRIIEMLVETGPSVSITTITNVLAFSIGALTPTPEIQLFSIGNALAVVMDFVFQLTIYAALMVIIGRHEIEREMNTWDDDQPTKTEECGKKVECKRTLSGLLDGYCGFLSNKVVSSLVMAGLAVYWYISIVSTMQMKAELSPDKLFLKDSSIVKIFNQRRQYIIPYYGVCWILVGNPGDVTDTAQARMIQQMVAEFEHLPGSVGKYSTKFWMRDFEDFMTHSKDIDEEEEVSDESFMGISQSLSIANSRREDLRKFLEWPEFSFWKGFVQLDDENRMTKFFLTTAFRGAELVDWSNRAALLNTWRKVADKYPQLNVSIYEEDAKFLDLIETMVSISTQSALFTFVSMFLVALLFISHPPTLFVATFSILSTSVGVFGLMSWWGADLDPIMMSATVMSIGFSVDIPSHISYHYFQTGKTTVLVKKRMKETIMAVGFPILQASLSTILCVLSLFFVDLHMSQIFAKCMLLVVIIGMIHGILIIPVIFSLIDSFTPASYNLDIKSSDSQTTPSVVVKSIVRLNSVKT